MWYRINPHITSRAPGVVNHNFSAARGMFKIRTRMKNSSEHLPFILLWEISCGSRATDPGDRIFAFLGLVGDGTEDVIVDYIKCTKEIFAEVMICRILSTRNLDIWRLIDRDARLPDTELSLPSWVMKFHSNMPADMFSTERIDASDAKSSSDKLLSNRVQVDLTSLTVRVVRLGKVKKLFDLWTCAFQQVQSTWRFTDLDTSNAKQAVYKAQHWSCYSNFVNKQYSTHRA